MFRLGYGSFACASAHPPPPAESSHPRISTAAPRPRGVCVPVLGGRTGPHAKRLVVVFFFCEKLMKACDGALCPGFSGPVPPRLSGFSFVKALSTLIISGP